LYVGHKDRQIFTIFYKDLPNLQFLFIISLSSQDDQGTIEASPVLRKWLIMLMSPKHFICKYLNRFRHWCYFSLQVTFTLFLNEGGLVRDGKILRTEKFKEQGVEIQRTSLKQLQSIFKIHCANNFAKNTKFKSSSRSHILRNGQEKKFCFVRE